MIEGHTFCQGRDCHGQHQDLLLLKLIRKVAKVSVLFCLSGFAREFWLGFFSYSCFGLGFVCVSVCFGSFS